MCWICRENSTACFRHINSSIQFAHELAKLCKCTKCPPASQNWHRVYVIRKQVVIVQFVPLFYASERGIQTIYLKPNKLLKNMPPWPKLAKREDNFTCNLERQNPQSVGQNSMLTKFTFWLGLFDHAFLLLCVLNQHAFKTTTSHPLVLKLNLTPLEKVRFKLDSKYQIPLSS